MKKQQPTQSKLGQNQKTIIPTVRYHPSIQIHAAGDGPAIRARSRPTAKLSPPTGNRKVVQQNQDTDNIIPGIPQPRPTGTKKQNQADAKLALGAVKTAEPPATLSSHCSHGGNGPEVMMAGSGVLTEIDKVEAQTRGQRNNPKWFDWRKNRITASVAHSIAHSRFVNGKNKTPPTSYLAAVTGKQHPPLSWTQSCDNMQCSGKVSSDLVIFVTHTGEHPRVQTRAMSWGVHKEKAAVHMYQAWKSDSLRRPVSVQECGLFIDPQRHWLAASPDGIVRDKQTGQRLLCLEVKCPYKHRHRRVEDACREDPAFCLEIRDQDGETSGQVKINT